MTDTEAALLRAIGAQPDEDTPRLVYADYLDEQGGESNSARAEFIRLQIRLERLPATESPERDSAQARARRLLDTWDTAWQIEMPPGFTRLAYYRRGFPFRAMTVASQGDGTDDPRLCSIEYLEFSPDVSPRELSATLRWPVFARLTELVVRGCQLFGGERVLDWVGATVFAEARFPRLERLTLAGQNIGARGLRVLSTARAFPRLRELNVSDNNIPVDAVDEFRNSALGSQLVRLFA